MRFFAVLSLPALLVACPASSGGLLHYRGEREIRYPNGLLVAGEKQAGRIVVGSVGHPYALPLPYAEDWVFEDHPKKQVSGSSRSLELFVTLQVFGPTGKAGERKFDEEEFLKEILAHNRANAEKVGLTIRDDAFRKVSNHVVLEYVTELRRKEMTYSQVHYFGSRQDVRGMVNDIHLSTNCLTEPKKSELREAAYSIIGKEFGFRPWPPSKSPE